MPFAPAPTPETATTEQVPLEPVAPANDSVKPPVGLLGGVPVREATPYQQPQPAPSSAAPPTPPTPPTRIIPAMQQRPAPEDRPFVPLVPREPSRAQRLLQLLGLGA